MALAPGGLISLNSLIVQTTSKNRTLFSDLQKQHLNVYLYLQEYKEFIYLFTHGFSIEHKLHLYETRFHLIAECMN